MARFMRAIQFSSRNKLDRPDKPGDDEEFEQTPCCAMMRAMPFDSLDLLAACALFAAGIGAWRMALPLRLAARLYARFSAILFAALAVSVPLGMAGVAALLLLPLAAASLMAAALARFARPLPAFAVTLALVAALAGGLAALLSGYVMLSLTPVMIAGLVVIAAALNGSAVIPLLAGVALLASGLAFLEEGARAGLFLFSAAAMVGLTKALRKDQLLRSSNSALRGAALP